MSLGHPARPFREEGTLITEPSAIDLRAGAPPAADKVSQPDTFGRRRVRPQPPVRPRAPGAGSGPGGEPGGIADLDGAIADPDQTVAFQVLQHLVQRGPLHAE